MNYHQVEDKSESDSQSADDCEGLLSQDSGSIFKKQPRGVPIWIAIFLVILSSIGFLGLGTWIGSRWTNGYCLEHVQKYCKFSNSSIADFKLTHEQLQY